MPQAVSFKTWVKNTRDYGLVLKFFPRIGPAVTLRPYLPLPYVLLWGRCWILTAMSKTPEPGNAPFSSVDSVSTDIFQRLGDIEHVGTLPDEHAQVVKSRLQRLGEFLLDAGPKLGENAEQSQQPAFDFAVIVEGADDGSYFTMSKEHQSKPRQPLAQYHSERVSFHAARKRAKLPDGIELLEGNSGRYDDTDTMSAIKVVMVQQKREIKRKSLPELEPAPFEYVIPEEIEDVEMAEQTPLSQKTRAHIVRFFRQDTVLAVSLSIWTVLLLLMVFDPQRVLPVFLTSVYFCCVCLMIFKPGKVLDTATKAWRRGVGALNARP
jgi:hypothetical protein